MSVPLPTCRSLISRTWNPRSHQCAPIAVAKVLHRCATFFPNNGPPITRVAVLGGGITGLSAAYYLTRLVPGVEVKLFEASERLGGWVQSKTVDVGTGKVVFEAGPRNLRPSRPSGLVTLQLAHQLGLKDDIIFTSKSSHAARSRYIYYPDHLTRIPSPHDNAFQILKDVFTEPLLKPIPRALIRSLFIRKPYSSDHPLPFGPQPDGSGLDESVASFVTRHAGYEVAQNIVAAVFHGVYAGNINKLSAQALLPEAWHLAARYSSLIRGFFKMGSEKIKPMSFEDAYMLRRQSSELDDILALARSVEDWSVYTFKGGISTLVERLVKKLEADTAVNIQMRASATKLEKIGLGVNAKVRLQWKEGSQPSGKSKDHVEEFSHVISTIPASSLTKAIEFRSFLQNQPAVTVMVVNLFYSDPHLVPVRGFGYLIPGTVAVDLNPHRALGVVFDSESCAGQDTAEGTKLTVMLGGHWWDSYEPSDFPSQEEGVRMARDVLKQHLGITDAPVLAQATLQKSSIPQYEYLHEGWVGHLHKALLWKYEGRLRVTGASYNGVGVNDCVRGAKDLVERMVDDLGQKTGIDAYASGQKAFTWVTTRPVQK